MVCKLENAIFCHVPKNAGSAVSYALGRVDRYWPMHVPARCLVDEGLPIFGFIRNPWDRMVSLYNFLLVSPPRHIQRVNPTQLKNMGFKRWLMEGETFMSNEPIDGDIWIRQNQKYMPVGPRNTYKNIHLLDHPTLGTPPMQRRPSLWWLEGVPSPYIGKVESLEEDLQRIAKALKFPYRRPRRANATRVRPVDYREMYDSESIEFVRHYHKLDIEAGNYGFT